MVGRGPRRKVTLTNYCLSWSGESLSGRVSMTEEIFPRVFKCSYQANTQVSRMMVSQVSMNSGRVI